MPLLSDSICFEVASEVHRREDQLKKNKSLVEQNAGILAPVTSTERFLSVGCSRRCARLRAVAAACHGPSGEQVQLQQGGDRSDGVRRALEVDGRGWWCLVRWSWRARCFPISSKEP